MPAGRFEVGVLSPSRWAVDDGVELGVHPLWFFALPHLEAKVRWWAQDDESLAESEGNPATSRSPRGWMTSTRHRLSYPTMFLSLTSGQGAGSLLPPTTDPPFVLQLDSDALASFVTKRQTVTARAGFAFAVRGDEALPLLDFPFLYQRFAPLYSPLVPRAGLGASGLVAEPVDYEVDVLASYLPLGLKYGVSGAWAVEGALRVHVRLGARHRLSAGARAAVAEFPIGWRLHWFPTLDYRFVLVDE